MDQKIQNISSFNNISQNILENGRKVVQLTDKYCDNCITLSTRVSNSKY